MFADQTVIGTEAFQQAKGVLDRKRLAPAVWPNNDLCGREHPASENGKRARSHDADETSDRMLELVGANRQLAGTDN